MQTRLDKTISGQPPVTAFEISADKRIDVLLSLHNIIRQRLSDWENRIYSSGVWSAGIFIGAAAFYLQNEGNLAHIKIFLVLSVFLFGSLIQTYLAIALTALRNNGVTLAQIEATLELCKAGAYIKDEPFFGYSGAWSHDKTHLIIRILNGAICVLSCLSMSFF